LGLHGVGNAVPPNVIENTTRHLGEKRWYVTYKLSYRDVRDLMAERGVTVLHNTVLRMGPTLRSHIRENVEEICASCRLSRM